MTRKEPIKPFMAMVSMVYTEIFRVTLWLIFDKSKYFQWHELESETDFLVTENKKIIFQSSNNQMF